VLTAVVPAACVAEGQDCHTSECCLDGGKSGLQCWAKNDFYAICASNETCKEGVHPGETHGTYDQYGKFHLDEWSCKKLGKRSLPGCSTYDEEEDCPEARCDWFHTGKCMAKCAQFGSKDACPQTHCVWDGAKCSVDPCSASGEDCSSTKCCSGGRGAAGQQCFQKGEYWATCMDYCDSNVTQKGWSCKKLGERTRFEAPCSWAGQSCSKTHCCSNEGFSCVVKDDTYSGCVKTNQHTTWIDQPVPLPAGWEGTKLGGWKSEYQVAAAAPGAPMAGTSFFCFMAILPKSNEEALMAVAKKNNAGIFACNASAVFHSWKSGSGAWDTGAATLINTAVFLKVMDWVKADGRYLQYDWSIKVDADCVFVPSRLRQHIWGLRPPPDTAMYLKNNGQGKMGNGGFLGAIEVFSKKAMEMYFDNADDCAKYLGTNSGEDGFFKGCMDAIGAGFMLDAQMFEPNFDPSKCTIASHAAFHPIKYASHWQRCWDLSFNNKCPGSTYDCMGPLDPPLSSLAGAR